MPVNCVSVYTTWPVCGCVSAVSNARLKSTVTLSPSIVNELTTTFGEMAVVSPASVVGVARPRDQHVESAGRQVRSRHQPGLAGGEHAVAQEVLLHRSHRRGIGGRGRGRAP